MNSDHEHDQEGFLTGVEDSSVHPALGVADRRASIAIVEEDLHAAGPGCGRHAVHVVPAPVAHQHPIIIPTVDLRRNTQSRSLVVGAR